MLPSTRGYTTVPRTKKKRRIVGAGIDETQLSSSVLAGASETTDDLLGVCAFCQASSAAVLVELPSLKKANKTIPTAYCLAHYYTTSACRESKRTRVIDPKTLEEQLPEQQELFAEAYMQLRDELNGLCLETFAKNKDDPLSVLSDLNKTSSNHCMKKRFPSSTSRLPSSSRDIGEGGGFLRHVPVPERLLDKQRKQLLHQQKLTERMNRAAAATKTLRDPSRRRQPTRKSIWNVILDANRNTRKPPPPPLQMEKHEKTIQDNNAIHCNKNPCSGPKCTCGSNDVQILSSNTSSRDEDMAKAETWGNKDRGGEIIMRCQCLKCGKTWNEEE
jgi:hypothetical protein